MRYYLPSFSCAHARAGKDMMPKHTGSNPYLFEISLAQMINLNQPLEITFGIRLGKRSPGNRALLLRYQRPIRS
jgi:hypothetical protein